MSLKRILAAAAVVIASLVSAGVAQPAFAAAQPAAVSLDPAFGAGGKVLTNLGTGANGQQIQAIPSDAVLQSNGDIVVSGTFGLVRYLPSGTLDTSFGTGGRVTTSFSVNALNLQPNGDIVAAGTGQGNTTSTGTFNVDRLTASGALDPAFGTGGTVTTTFPQTALGAGATTVLVEPDGNILVGGGAGAPGKDNTVVNHEVLALYNPDGTLDQAFGAGGLVRSSGGQAQILGVDAAGDIFVTDGGELSPTGQPDASATAATIVASSAGGTGVSIGGNTAAAFLPNGATLTAIGTTFGRRIVGAEAEQLNPDGTFDTAFFNPAFQFSGTTVSAPGSIPAAVAVQANGQIVIAGTNSTGSTSVFGLGRLNASGSLDTTFGTGGVLTTSFQGHDHAVAVLIQPSNGDIIAIGRSTNSAGVTELALARYLG
jgi:uncharacterized delta-60 repeat protein